jgi:hypothetical protein
MHVEWRSRDDCVMICEVADMRYVYVAHQDVAEHKVAEYKAQGFMSYWLYLRKRCFEVRYWS